MPSKPAQLLTFDPAKKGSTLRMDWKPRSPHQYASYFKITSKLVETFRLDHWPILTFKGCDSLPNNPTFKHGRWMHLNFHISGDSVDTHISLVNAVAHCANQLPVEPYGCMALADHGDACLIHKQYEN